MRKIPVGEFVSTYFKAGQINPEEIHVLLAQLAVEQNIPFESVETSQAIQDEVSGYEINVVFTEAPSEGAKSMIADLIANYTYIPPVVDPTYPEYADSAAAISGGLVVGDIFRTGEILKQVVLV